eukprot:CAMPEP_0116896806 /NCGR_PEP_ID=MMETSP0467-20121206/5964_1 /TAXON_ID=283647 /ORGANISM="Mesodinium pulex, Strain SPMC105" /LENGTH=95 /DNA_ID=CAMNT_0004568173 /DNA_START=1467 /DNA_END=1754 /DNA_ORIENTATION=-
MDDQNLEKYQLMHSKKKSDSHSSKTDVDKNENNLDGPENSKKESKELNQSDKITDSSVTPIVADKSDKSEEKSFNKSEHNIDDLDEEAEDKNNEE